MAGFENNVMVAKNLNFDQAASPPHLGIIDAAGKIPIGTGNSAPTPEILGGSLTSPNNSITFGYSSPNITAVVNTSIITDLHVAKLIVNPGGLSAGANFTTITSALANASPGDTIFVMPATYTENLTLKAGVNICAFVGDDREPNVTIIGKLTATFAGTATISNIRLQTNSDFFLEVTGTNATIINLERCYLNITNNTGIHSTSSASSIFVRNCIGNIATTGITLYSVTGAGVMSFEYSYITNSGNSVTASNTSSGLVKLFHSVFDFPFSTSSSGSVNGWYTMLQTGSNNATSFTTAGTGQPVFQNCLFEGGTSSALSIGSGTSVNLWNCRVDSSNTNAITGAGTLMFTPVHFTGTSSGNNVTTLTPRSMGPVIINTTQPAFLARMQNTVTNVTGNGTLYTVIFDTEVFDQGNNFNLATSTFTAPFSGIYHFDGAVTITGSTASTGGQVRIVTTGRTFGYEFARAASANDWQGQVSTYANMAAGDTATLQVISNGEGADTDDVLGNAIAFTYFGGKLEC